MEPQFRAADGASAWQISNPPILSATPLIASLAIFAEAGLPRLRTKSVALTDFMDALVRRLEPQVHILTPRASSARGCQLSMRIAGGPQRGRARVRCAPGARHGVRLAQAGHHPRGARAPVQPLRGRAQFAQALGEILRRTRMKSAAHPPVNIVGAGLAGALLALLLARRGYPGNALRAPTRPAPVAAPSAAARSISRSPHAACARWSAPGFSSASGRCSFRCAAAWFTSCPARSRLQPYGQREHEVIYSVGRADLNRVLIEEAVRHAGVSVRVQPAVPGRGSRAQCAAAASISPRAAEREVALAPTIATDGAGSAVRSGLAARGS